MTINIRLWLKNTVLVISSFLVAAGFAEIALVIADIPSTDTSIHYTPPRKSAQFRFMTFSDPAYEEVGYVNKPSSSIRFIYDGNPRGYFGELNEVEHKTNSLGFRGEEFDFEPKENTLRIVFLGDSYTFGEGVHFEDTYPERVKQDLMKRMPGIGIECLNFGVGGFNTVQEEALLRFKAIKTAPDAIVVGYTMSDAYPKLFYFDRKARAYRRRDTGMHAAQSDAYTPDYFPYNMRIISLLRSVIAKHRQTENTIEHFRNIYADDNPGWKNAKKAIKSIADICRSNGIHCYAAIFPRLFHLDSYPLKEEHKKIISTFKEYGFTVVDILPAIMHYEDTELWVHPTDQHPNEIVHGITGKLLAEKIYRDNLTKR